MPFGDAFFARIGWCVDRPEECAESGTIELWCDRMGVLFCSGCSGGQFGAINWHVYHSHPCVGCCDVGMLICCVKRGVSMFNEPFM